MDIFVLLSLLGGVSLFLFGMHQMGGCLEKAAGPKLEGLLEKMTRDRMRAVLLGIAITTVMQSSSTTTVMVVGFVNSGIMRLAQAVPVIMGANVGTTVTSWILSLSGIESGGLLLQLLKPSSFTPVVAAIGVAMMTVAKTDRKKSVGGALAGFAILMFGMQTMTDAVKPLANDPNFQQFFLAFDNPWLGMLVGALLTGIIQSSAASVGILQALSATGSITYAIAIPIILGQNIGTCVTALLSSIGANKAARRTSMVHLYFNVIGSVLFMIAFLLLKSAFPFLNDPVNIVGIAIVHTIFNVAVTAVLLPFTGLLEKLVIMTVPDKKGSEDEVLLDDRLLATPTFALARCRMLTARMAKLANESVLMSLGLLHDFNEERVQLIQENEDKVDHLEDALGTFLVRLNKTSLSEREVEDVTRILHGINDLERISDHSINILDTAREIHDKQIGFTQDARDEMKVLYLAVCDILALATKAYNDSDVEQAKRVEPLEEVIDNLVDQLKNRHIERLQQGRCTVETGFVFSDLLTNLERVADHCSNLAVCVVELNSGVYNAHEYLEEEWRRNQFIATFNEIKEEYRLPDHAPQNKEEAKA